MNLLKLVIKKNKLSLTSRILMVLATISSSFSVGNINAQGNSFICTQDGEGTPTTYILVPDGQIPLFSWQSTYFKPPYTPMRRCQEVTQRLSNFQAQGILREFYPGKAKTGEPIICAGSCRSDGSNIIYTLKPNQDPKTEIDKLIAHKEGRTNDALPQSSASGDNSIFNLDEYIKSSPIEPRTNVTNSSPSVDNNNGGSNGSSRWGNQ